MEMLKMLGFGAKRLDPAYEPLLRSFPRSSLGRVVAKSQLRVDMGKQELAKQSSQA